MPETRQVSPVAETVRRRCGLVPGIWSALLIAIPIVIGTLTGSAESRAAEASPTPNWPSVLAEMPVETATTPLARSNAIQLLIHSFRSNGVVRALVILPGVVDDFHLIHRDAALPAREIRHLAQAISVLTNLTPMRVTWQNSLLILHTDSDRTMPEIQIRNPRLLPRLQQAHNVPSLVLTDTHWEIAQPQLKKLLKLTVRPEAQSQEAWHFERFNLSAHGLSDWELLAACALSTGTRLVLDRGRVSFERPTR